MNYAFDPRTVESKMADKAHQKLRSDEKLRALVRENDLVIDAMMTNRKELMNTVPQVDKNAAGLGALLHDLSRSSKKLTPMQRNRLLRSINNAMNAIGSLKKDLGSISFDCGMQASALKYRNDGLKRDLNRRKI